MNLLWRNYPVVFALPFLMAALGLEGLARVGEVGRWGVMVVCLGIASVASVAFFRIRLRHYDWVFLAFLMVAMLSSFWSINGLYSAMRALSMALLYACVFFGFRSYTRDFGSLALIQKLVGTSSVFLALNLLFAIALGAPLGIGRFQGFFANPNGVGSISGLCLPFLFFFSMAPRSWMWRCLFILTLTSLLMAGSRGPLIAALFGISILSLPHFKKRMGKLVLIGGSLLLFFGYFSTTDYFKENVLRVETLETMSTRTEFWELGRSYISERPWLGFGFGTDSEIHDYHGLQLSDVKLRGYGVMSSYLGLAVQLGVPLTIVFYSYFILAVIVAAIAYGKDPYVMAYAAATCSGLLIGIGESVLYSAGNAFGFIFWCFPMLLSERIVRIQLRERRRRRRDRRDLIEKSNVRSRIRAKQVMATTGEAG